MHAAACTASCTRGGEAIILHIVGARPQFIKLAPVVRAFRDLSLPYKVLHTGQHYDYTMSDLHFSSLGLADPDFHLGIGSGSHARQTARMLEGIETVLVAEKPSCILVYGDTNSTLAGALSAAKLKVPVGHVEAGVRSFDKGMPEEINRLVADHVSDHHFCPTANALALLQHEGITGTLTGDVMYDALLQTPPEDLSHPYTTPFGIVTIHRAENTDAQERFHAIWEGLRLIAKELPMLFPVHPRTRSAFGELLRESPPGIRVIEPVSYFTMLAMIRDASLVITDSGGVQKEAFLLGSPCVTVRDVTEWPETVQAGANRLSASEPEALYHAAQAMMGRRVVLEENPFGNGRASSAIAEFVKGVYN
ncbi:MAG TPA: UDP-N-acetylglucosamine 2-epimerase (non-hydrolyzing) [Deltaproteobacteria bacterium]|nr:UDP-N-acetylglucosamine 2-epimerase (non-hydrolyzing) [Deltaproteobacteria bacterium]